MSFIKLFWKKEEWLLEMNSLPDSASEVGLAVFTAVFGSEKQQKKKTNEGKIKKK